MQEFLEELKDIRHVSFATVTKDSKPRSRILDIMDIDIENNGFYFLTGHEKDVFKEIENNKNVALNVMLEDFRIYRVEGEVEFKGDRDYLLEINPEVAKLYAGHEEKLSPLYVSIKKASKFYLENGAPKTIEYK